MKSLKIDQYNRDFSKEKCIFISSAFITSMQSPNGYHQMAYWLDSLCATGVQWYIAFIPAICPL